MSHPHIEGSSYVLGVITAFGLAIIIGTIISLNQTTENAKEINTLQARVDQLEAQTVPDATPTAKIKASPTPKASPTVSPTVSPVASPSVKPSPSPAA